MTNGVGPEVPKNGHFYAYVIVAALAGGGGYFSRDVLSAEKQAVTASQMAEAIKLHASTTHGGGVSEGEFRLLEQRLTRIERLLDELLILERKNRIENDEQALSAPLQDLQVADFACCVAEETPVLSVPTSSQPSGAGRSR